jgi:hypothetical protein
MREPLDLEPIKARERAATPGPWEWEPQPRLLAEVVRLKHHAEAMAEAIVINDETKGGSYDDVLESMEAYRRDFPKEARDAIVPAARTEEGWTWLLNSRKWHYFRDNRSLCCRYGLLGLPEFEGDANSRDNCAECQRRRMKEMEAMR